MTARRRRRGVGAAGRLGPGTDQHPVAAAGLGGTASRPLGDHRGQPLAGHRGQHLRPAVREDRGRPPVRALQRQPLQQRPPLPERQLPGVVAVEVQQVADPQLAASVSSASSSTWVAPSDGPSSRSVRGARQLGAVGVGDPGPAALHPHDHPAAAEPDLQPPAVAAGERAGGGAGGQRVVRQRLAVRRRVGAAQQPVVLAFPPPPPLARRCG